MKVYRFVRLNYSGLKKTIHLLLLGPISQIYHGRFWKTQVIIQKIRGLLTLVIHLGAQFRRCSGRIGALGCCRTAIVVTDKGKKGQKTNQGDHETLHREPPKSMA